MMIDTLKKIFERDLKKLKFEIESYLNEDKIWHIEKEIANSAGNLCLHLIGNLNTYIGAQIGKTNYIRNRELEFSDSDVSKVVLIAKIEATIQTVNDALNSIDDSDLEKEHHYLVFEAPTSTFFFTNSSHNTSCLSFGTNKLSQKIT